MSPCRLHLLKSRVCEFRLVRRKLEARDQTRKSSRIPENEILRHHLTLARLYVSSVSTYETEFGGLKLIQFPKSCTRTPMSAVRIPT